MRRDRGREGHFASPPDTDLDETAHAFDDPEGVLDAAVLDRGLHMVRVALVVVYGALVPIVVVREAPPPGRPRESRRFNLEKAVDPSHRLSSGQPEGRRPCPPSKEFRKRASQDEREALEVCQLLRSRFE